MEILILVAEASVKVLKATQSITKYIKRKIKKPTQ